MAQGPQFVRYFGVLLDALRALGGEAPPDQVRSEIVRRLALSSEVLAEQTASGQSRFANQVAWARFYLARAGLLDATDRGIWRLSESGRDKALDEDAAVRLFKEIQTLFGVAGGSAEQARIGEGEGVKEIIEEQSGGQQTRTGVELEQLGTGVSGLSSPYDPTRIRVDPRTFSLGQVLQMIDDGDLDLAPDFQRNKVWKAPEKSRLIESILLRIPLPAFYFAADVDGRMRVVDGLQRLSTVSDFVKGVFVLRHLEYLGGSPGQLDGKGLNEKSFAQLEATWKRRIHQTQIFVNVIDPQTPPQVKFDIFKRINTGGEPLNAQEIRHCMSSGRTRQFLKDCTELPSFHKATGGALREHVRMADREVVLRFCAFRTAADRERYYVKGTSMDAFLTDTTESLDKQITDAKLEELKRDFDRSMENAWLLFGENAFRKWPRGSDRVNPINRALFESWAVALADHDPKVLVAHSGPIRDATRTLMGDRDFDAAISVSTGDPSKVRTRFDAARILLDLGVEGSPIPLNLADLIDLDAR